jgi:clan AA aspartic protease (TIGR02281 family)
MRHMGSVPRSRGWLAWVMAVAAMTATLPMAQAQSDPFKEGVDYFQGGHYRWALEKFIEAVDLAPRDVQRRWYLAESYRQLGDIPAAAHVYRDILQMAAQSPIATDARRALEALGEPTLSTIQVAFQRRGASVLVPAKVNGKQIGHFILDTGATFTSISQLVANQLGIPGSGGSVRLSTASGVIQATLTILEEVDVGGAVARHVPAVIHDLPSTHPPIVGLLGLSFLERFRVNLDLTSGMLILESGR